jgi:hypothetical protein
MRIVDLRSDTFTLPTEEMMKAIFFLVLIDLRNLEDSWKLKRNKKLLRKEINGFLDRNTEIDFQKLKLSFKWENRIYTTYSTILFVLRS